MELAEITRKRPGIRGDDSSAVTVSSSSNTLGATVTEFRTKKKKKAYREYV